MIGQSSGSSRAYERLDNSARTERSAGEVKHPGFTLLRIEEAVKEGGKKRDVIVAEDNYNPQRSRKELGVSWLSEIPK